MTPDTNTDPTELPPPPPPFATSCELDPSCEEDVDLDDVDQPDEDDDDEYCPCFGEHEQDLLRADTTEEEVEFMGEASSLEEYFRNALEDFVDHSIHSLIFDSLDFATVQEKFEAGRYRYILEGRAVYRAGLPKKPSKDKDDSPGPWMPTRGG